MIIEAKNSAMSLQKQDKDIAARRDLPIRRLLSPMRRFLEIESASGVVLLCCAALAVALANSPWAKPFSDLWHTSIGITIGSFEFHRPLEFWVNDGLMTVFFFVVGLEIKREMVSGELSEWRKAALPIFGAIGGMVAPALIYLLICRTEPMNRGWGIPMATDIAFVVGIMAAFGRRLPVGIKIFLLALAIADDIGAVLVIAVAYSHGVALNWLYIGLGGFVITVVMNLIGVRLFQLYVVAGLVIWCAFLQSEVHPTVAGVILGLLTPSTALIPMHGLREVAQDVLDQTEGDLIADTAHQRALMSNLAWTASESVSPLERLEAALHPIVAFAIMPIFALCNAGIPIEIAALRSPVALAVTAGLVLGKPLGIVSLSYFAVKLGLAKFPTGTTRWHMIAAGCLAGIGFTMAIFVAGLAFSGHAALLATAKAGIFLGSILSAMIGAGILCAVTTPPRDGPKAPISSANP